MEGSRRVLPSYGSPCLLKGHLSTKSNAFCTDSSSLNTFLLVESHMAAHYTKILSAKAAVDCSVPLSMSTSIKYADQQRREKLKRELARCEKEQRLAKPTGKTSAANSPKSLMSTLKKPSGEPQDETLVFIEEVNGFQPFGRSPVSSSERLPLRPSKPSKTQVKGAGKKASSPPSSLGGPAARPRRASPGTKRARGSRSTFSSPFRLAISKTPSADLLDKHSDQFSNQQLPFTPRTLKTEAKSFLSQYRYYTPARRKKAQPPKGEAQTEISSSNSDFEKAKTENLTDSETSIKQAPHCITDDAKGKLAPVPSQGCDLMWDDIKDGVFQNASPRTITKYSVQPCSGRSIHSDEEELLYLSFIEDITDEVLKLGLFSNRFLERLFERHIEENKHHLEEGKMRHLLHVLKANLGFLTDQTSGKQSDSEMLTVIDFEKTEISEQMEFKRTHEITVQQERQEYQKLLNIFSVQKNEKELLSPTNDFYLPTSNAKTYSEEVVIHQVNDETKHNPSKWEQYPTVSEFIYQETSVNVIEGDSDTENIETSNEFSCLRPLFSRSGQRPRLTGDNSDLEGPTLKIIEMGIRD
ncbi:spermatogenesis-associated protein 7 isoform X1 [Echinops telfairi]|uniref:Spermatogenesis-associated protein 7 isoform X1 n=4 Tax=Echinops telfairi TaxID=9371 RepID=A0ABM1VJB4_ECHTE|nr:spermatogenesis-associated protein 7 isoform X1 [Echinops telfairi]